MLQLSPNLIVSIILCYFVLLIIISFFTSRNISNEDFYVAGRKSPWFVVAFGMIGSSLSGVTFISIPGVVGATPEFMEQLTGQATVRQNIQFSYMQIVFGYFLGYAVIALVLLPIYYRLKLTSNLQLPTKTDLGYLPIKRVLLFHYLSYHRRSLPTLLVALVMQRFVMDAYGIPFWATVAISILLIWIYT
ncbi:MAG: sodium:solute symporter, partial [Saprospiraceae bacterium]|nr:sodium:solute symporter [Saprospiraceae bacterium]